MIAILRRNKSETCYARFTMDDSTKKQKYQINAGIQNQIVSLPAELKKEAMPAPIPGYWLIC
jgi:hypothetical protein